MLYAFCVVVTASFAFSFFRFAFRSLLPLYYRSFSVGVFFLFCFFPSIPPFVLVCACITSFMLAPWKRRKKCVFLPLPSSAKRGGRTMAAERSVAPAKKDVRVFQSGIDTSSVASTVFSQPSMYMGIANMLIMYLTQRFPEEFMTPRHMTMSYNGVRASAMLTIPFCCTAGAYFSVASVISTSAVPLAGHLYGYTVSLGVGLGMLTFRRVSWYYPLLGLMYLSFGGFHHYRRMMVYGDNAPIFNWGDAAEIWNARAAAKRERRLEKERLMQLQKQRDI